MEKKKIFLYCEEMNSWFEGSAFSEGGDQLDLQKGESKEEVKKLLMAREHRDYEKVWVDDPSTHVELKKAIKLNSKRPDAKIIISVSF